MASKATSRPRRGARNATSKFSSATTPLRSDPMMVDNVCERDTSSDQVMTDALGTSSDGNTSGDGSGACEPEADEQVDGAEPFTKYDEVEHSSDESEEPAAKMDKTFCKSTRIQFLPSPLLIITIIATVPLQKPKPNAKATGRHKSSFADPVTTSASKNSNLPASVPSHLTPIFFDWAPGGQPGLGLTPVVLETKTKKAARIKAETAKAKKDETNRKKAEAARAKAEKDAAKAEKEAAAANKAPKSKRPKPCVVKRAVATKKTSKAKLADDDEEDSEDEEDVKVGRPSPFNFEPGYNPNLPPLTSIDQMFAHLGQAVIGVGMEELTRLLDGRALYVGTFCSGTESPILAMKLLKECKL